MYRLGIDLGTNSLGWAVLPLDDEGRPSRLENAGVRIFDSGRKPKDGSSLAVDRRLARGARRRRDRQLLRKQDLLKQLREFNLFPQDKESAEKLKTLKPYELRKRALDEELSPYELGRAIFHLGQRRGFKSNRRADSGSGDKEAGKIRQGVLSMQAALDEHGCRTPGEYYWQLIKTGQPVRSRLVGQGAHASYLHYLDRSMVEDEFRQIWAHQQSYKPDLLSDEVGEALLQTILRQRKLKPQAKGKCLLTGEDRAYKALPSSQRVRLLGEVNEFRLRQKVTGEKRALTLEERNQAVSDLSGSKKRSFDQIIKRILPKDQQDNWELTLDTAFRSEVAGDETSYLMKNKKAFGARWAKYSLAEQDEIILRLLEDDSEDEVIEFLEVEHGLTFEEAQHVALLNLPDGVIRLSTTAALALIEQYENGWDVEQNAPLTYSQAVLAAGYDSHTRLHSGEKYQHLPYYGTVMPHHGLEFKNPAVEGGFEYRISNPTVHIGLNQLRKVVNAVIERYGEPSEIVVELARDLPLGAERKSELERRNRENREANAKIDQQLLELGQKVNRENRIRMKLYNELSDSGHLCVYTGRSISLSKLFTNEFQIDHILPLSRTLDDSFANKVLVHNSANRYKGNRTPFEAFGRSLDGYSWDEVSRLSESLPKNKRVRFDEDAMERYTEGEGFLARQLNDTSYMARVAKEYLTYVCEPNNVWVTTGRLTGLLRAKLGLNELIWVNNKKNRDDHRHHAVDAIVVGLSDRALLQQVARAASRAVEEDAYRDFVEFPDLPERLRQDIVQRINTLVASHRPDHNPAGRLHDETAVGVVDGPDSKGKFITRSRLSVDSLKVGDIGNLELPSSTRNLLASYLDIEHPTEADLSLLKDQLSALGYKRVALLRKNQSIIPIKNANGDIYKGYRGNSNYCYEIFEDDRGRWDGNVISRFEANQMPYRNFQSEQVRYLSQTFLGQPLIMRIFVGDSLAMGLGSSREIYRVQKISAGKITVAGINEANPDQRARDPEQDFSFITKSPNALKQSLGRKVLVTVLGQVLDPFMSREE